MVVFLQFVDLILTLQLNTFDSISMEKILQIDWNFTISLVELLRLNDVYLGSYPSKIDKHTVVVQSVHLIPFDSIFFLYNRPIQSYVSIERIDKNAKIHVRRRQPFGPTKFRSVVTTVVACYHQGLTLSIEDSVGFIDFISTID